MRKSILIALVTTALSSVAANATVVDLNFEGINTDYTNTTSYAFINGFYNGGTSSEGTSGTNYGITFSPNAQAICLTSMTVICSNTSRGGLAPGSSEGGLFFLSGSLTDIDVAAGFQTGFSFNYSAPFDTGSVSVYSGLDGSGTLLNSFSLPTTTSTGCPGYTANFCPFVPIGVTFSGTAESIVFGGVANEIVMDDVTFGSSTPGTGGVPEPSTWAMMLAGLAITGGALRSRRRIATA